MRNIYIWIKNWNNEFQAIIHSDRMKKAEFPYEFLGFELNNEFIWETSLPGDLLISCELDGWREISGTERIGFWGTTGLFISGSSNK